MSNRSQIMSHATQIKSQSLEVTVFHQSSMTKLLINQLSQSQSKQKIRHSSHAPSSLMQRKRLTNKLILHQCNRHQTPQSNNHTATISSLSKPLQTLIIPLATAKMSCITLSNGIQIKCTKHQTTFRRKLKTLMLTETLQKSILANITSKIIASGPSSSANSVNKISESKRKINKSNNT